MSVEIEIQGTVHAAEVKHRRANRKLREENTNLHNRLTVVEESIEKFMKLKNDQKTPL